MSAEQKYYLIALGIICMSLVCCRVSSDRVDERRAEIELCAKTERATCNFRSESP